MIRRPLVGEVEVPGDKSISHRAVMVGALATGRSRLENVNPGLDVGATVSAVESLGARCHHDRDKAIAQVDGCGLGGLTEPPDVIDAGNSGTTLRIAAGLCATVSGISVLTGDASLRTRPMGRVANPLRRMGAAVDGRDNGEFAPLVVRGGSLTGIDVSLPVASAQVKSALLLAGLGAEGTTSITEPAPSRDHTERMLAASGVELQRSGTTVGVAGGQEPAALDMRIPGDISSALYAVVAAGLIPGSDLTLTGVGLNPTRCGALEVLRAMGAAIEATVSHEEGGEPVGELHVRPASLTGVDIDPRLVPSLIDEIPVLAVAASQADGDTVITGAAELRVKESDRIEAVVAGLNTLGGRAEALPDGMVIRGPARLHGGAIDDRGDHRIALAFAVAGLVAGEAPSFTRWGSADTSWPGFWSVIERVGSARDDE